MNEELEPVTEDEESFIERKRRELIEALEADKVQEPISTATLIGMLVSTSISLGSSPVTRAVGKKKPCA